MHLSTLRSLCLPALLWVVLAVPAAARPIDCSAEGQAGASRCLIATERVQSGRDPLSYGAGPPSTRASLSSPAPGPVAVGWWFVAPPTAQRSVADDGPAFALSGSSEGDEPPWAALLLATVCIVAFMAHRRGGG